MTVYAYLRTSTTDQVNGIEVQRNTIGTKFTDTVEIVEHASGKSVRGRPLFTKLLRQLQPGDTLVVSKLDRFARSVVDAVTVANDLVARGVTLVIIDLDLDMRTPMGKLVFSVLSAVAEFERALISERTTAGLAVVKASGKTLGKPSVLNCAEIRQARASGESAVQIAARLGVSKAAIYRCLERG